MIEKVFDLALLIGHYYLTKEEREERRKQKEREERRLAEREYEQSPQKGNEFSYSVKMENCENCSITISNSVEYHYYHE